MPPRRFVDVSCAVCRTVFRPRRDNNRFCSNACSAKSRGKLFYRTMGQKGGSTSGRVKRDKLKAALGAQVDHLTPQAAFLAGARWQTKRLGSALARRKFTQGFNAGWDACAAQFALEIAPRIRARALAGLAPAPEKPTVREAHQSFKQALQEAL